MNNAGEALVLGGVFHDTSNDNENGIPYFRSIPGLGWLFKRLFGTTSARSCWCS